MNEWTKIKNNMKLLFITPASQELQYQEQTQN